MFDFSRAVLEMQWSNGLHEMGYPKWQLVVCLLIIYSMLYISLFKGVKSSGKFSIANLLHLQLNSYLLIGKVVWITATMPYVVLTILLIRGLMLPGAISGISYYLQPELTKLKETQVRITQYLTAFTIESFISRFGLMPQFRYFIQLVLVLEYIFHMPVIIHFTIIAIGKLLGICAKL